MTTNAIQNIPQPQAPVSTSTPVSQGRFSLNCNTFIKLATLVSSVAAAVIAYIAEQYLIAGLTASLAAFAVYTFCRRGAAPTTQPSTTPPTPGQTPQTLTPHPLDNTSESSSSSSSTTSSAHTTPRGGSGGPSSSTPSSAQPQPSTASSQRQSPRPQLTLTLNNTSGLSENPTHSSSRSGSGSASPSTASSSSGAEELDDIDEGEATPGNTGSGSPPRTPIALTVATLQNGKSGADSITSSNLPSNNSSPFPSRSSSERNLAALDLAEPTRKSPVRQSVTISASSSDDEEGSVVEHSDKVQGSDPTNIAQQSSLSTPQDHPTLRTAGRDSENEEMKTLDNGRTPNPQSVVRSLTPTFNALAENVTHTDSENLIDVAFIEEEGT